MIKSVLCSISVLGTTSNLRIRSDILSSLRNKAKPRAELDPISRSMSVALPRHTKAVNAMHWSPAHGKLSLLKSFLL